MIEGKVSNQSPVTSLYKGSVKCARCSKLIPPPSSKALTIKIGEKEHTFLIFHYIGTDYWTYESKLGFSVNYCSEYCRNKHNHRFSQKG